MKANPILNLTMIRDIQEVMGEDAADVIPDLINSFLNDAPKQIGKMKTGVQENDRELVHLAAHTLKGSSANLGAEYLSTTSYELETSVESDEFPSILVKIDNIESALKSTEVALQQVASTF